MANKKSLANKYGMQGLGFNDDFMSQHMGGGGNSSPGVQPAKQTYQQTSSASYLPDYLKGASSMAPNSYGVPNYLQANTSSQSAANPNGSKVGVDASKQATQALTGSTSADFGVNAPTSASTPQGMIDMESVNNYGEAMWGQDDKNSFELRIPGLDVSSVPKKYAPAMPTPKLSVGQKLANSKVGQMGGKAMEMGGKAMETMSKYAGPLAMASTAVGLVDRVGTANKAVKSLKGGISDLQGVMNSASNTEFAAEEAMSDEFSEERRRIGARQNLALGETLNRVKGSNLNTGSIQKIKDNITDKYNISADLSLADSEDAYAAKRDQYTLESREERAQNKSQLEQLQAQLKEQEKAASPWNAIGDLVVAGVTIANPAAGMALGMAKSQIA